MSEGRLEQLGPGVHAWLQEPPGHGVTNAGVVVEADGITVVDTLMVRSQWEPFGMTVEGLGPPVRLVVLTSSHIEFVGGTPRFAAAARYGRAQTSAHLDQPPNVAGYRALFPEHAGELDDDLRTRPVSHVVAEPAWLTPAALAIPTTGQQLENLVVQVPGADVLFAGAMCCFGVTPNAFEGDPVAWADSLGELATIATRIVPGIGPVGSAEDVTALQAYLYSCAEADGDPGAIPEGPWDEWADRDLDIVNVERAAMLASGDRGVPSSMLRRLGMT